MTVRVHELARACKWCRHVHRPVGAGEMFECRRSAPAAVLTPARSHPEVVAWWPGVSPDDWCSEWADRPSTIGRA